MIINSPSCSPPPPQYVTYRTGYTGDRNTNASAYLDRLDLLGEAAKEVDKLGSALDGKSELVRATNDMNQLSVRGHEMTMMHTKHCKYLSSESLGILEQLVDGVEVLQVRVLKVVEERLLLLQGAVQGEGEDGQRGRYRPAIETRALEECISKLSCIGAPPPNPIGYSGQIPGVHRGRGGGEASRGDEPRKAG